MTPAENPVETERKRELVRLAKKAIALPMPVAMPATTVSPIAIQRLSIYALPAKSRIGFLLNLPSLDGRGYKGRVNRYHPHLIPPPSRGRRNNENSRRVQYCKLHRKFHTALIQSSGPGCNPEAAC